MDTQVIAPIVNFAAVVFILVHFGKKPLQDFLANRSSSIAKAMTDGEREYALASGQLQQWESNWSALEAHMQTARREAEAMVSRYRETALAAARKEVDRVRQDAKLIGQSEALKARRQLEREIVERSVYSASHYLRTHLDDTDKTRLVGEYLEKLGNGKA